MFFLNRLGLSLCCLPAALHAATYYVSPSGNDDNSGLFPGAAWRTVGKINALALQPGDAVLFEGGGVFSDAGVFLDSADAGDASSPVVMGSYGAGRAILQPPYAQDGVMIYNTSGVIIRDFDVSGSGPTTSTRKGIVAYCDLANGAKLPGIQILNCEVSGFYYGVLVGAGHGSFSGFRDVTIADTLVRDCRRDGIVMYGAYPGSAANHSHAALVIRDCEVTGVTGDPGYNGGHSGSGIIVSGVKGGLVERCHAHHNGGSAGNSSGGGPVGIWTWNADSITVQNSLVHDQKTTPGVNDGGGFDIDGGSTNVTFQYCYSHSNEGPGFLVAEFDHAPPLTNGTIRYNVSWRDGRRVANEMASGVHFWKGAGSGATLGSIEVYNNLFYTEAATGGPAVVFQAGVMAGLRVRNNLMVVQGGERFVDVNDTAATTYFTFQGNLYHALDGNLSGGWRWGAYQTYTDLAAWRASFGAPETLAGAPVGKQADPLIAQLAAYPQPTTVAELLAFNALRLPDGSPAVDAGLDLRQPAFGAVDPGTRDLAGHGVPYGRAFDVGPLESPFPLEVPEIFIGMAAAPSSALTLTLVPQRADVNYRVESSADLVNWTPATVLTFNVTQLEQPFTFELPAVSPRPVRGFFRLQISSP